MRTFSTKRSRCSQNAHNNYFRIHGMKKAMEQHQDDVKKAIKIHKANERLAKQNLQFKEQVKRLSEELEQLQGMAHL